MELARSRPHDRVRLEWPLPGSGIRAADILVAGVDAVTAIELKYMTQRLDCVVDGEAFRLRAQGAQDIRRYDVFKDIARMEEFATSHQRSQAFVIVLTNDPLYWTGPSSSTNCSAFSLRDGRIASGNLAWAMGAGTGTTRNREKPIFLKGEYQMTWAEYSNVGGKTGRFRFALHEILGN